MNKLSELASRILAHLEEAHAENVSSTINTVASVSGDIAEVSHAQSALTELTNLDYVRIAYEVNLNGKRLAPVSKEQSLADIGTIAGHLNFSVSEKIWKWDASPRMEIIATPSGLARSRDILDERGYEWWRQS